MRVLFSGRVQGVDFRYSTCHIAESFKLTGYVSNRPDGNVDVVAEGQKQELVDFLNAIRESRLARYIVRERLQWAPPTGKYKKFGVSH